MSDGASGTAARIGTDGAYYEADTVLTRESVGEVTPYHTESGIHAATAMIAAARGDTSLQRRAIGAFLLASGRPCAARAITHGRPNE